MNNKPEGFVVDPRHAHHLVIDPESGEYKLPIDTAKDAREVTQRNYTLVRNRFNRIKNKVEADKEQRKDKSTSLAPSFSMSCARKAVRANDRQVKINKLAKDSRARIEKLKEVSAH